MEARDFLIYQVYPCVWYREDIVSIFYVDDCLMFDTSKHKIDNVYASLWAYLNIEDYWEFNKYLGIRFTVSQIVQSI